MQSPAAGQLCHFGWLLSVPCLSALQSHLQCIRRVRCLLGRLMLSTCAQIVTPDMLRDVSGVAVDAMALAAYRSMLDTRRLPGEVSLQLARLPAADTLLPASAATADGLLQCQLLPLCAVCTVLRHLCCGSLVTPGCAQTAAVTGAAE